MAAVRKTVFTALHCQHKYFGVPANLFKMAFRKAAIAVGHQIQTLVQQPLLYEAETNLLFPELYHHDPNYDL